MSIFFIFCLLISLSLSLKTSDICLISKKNGCNEVYNFRCTLDYCARDKSACKDFMELNIYLKQIIKTKTYLRIKSMIQTINECNKNILKLKPTEKPCICNDQVIRCNENYCKSNRNECDKLTKRLTAKCCKPYF
jgi:hypothetical protein